MKLSKLISILNAKVVTDNYNPNLEILKGFASDLMSDVLTINADNILLITGLNNIQTIRTAEMADINVIVIVRNKKINEDMILLSQENNITLIECEYSLFKTVGILYSNELESVY